MTSRFDANALRDFGKAVLTRYGLEGRHADITSAMLVEADLLGHHTHGLDLLPGYVSLLEKSEMTKSGAAIVLSDAGSRALWDGRLLPGQSLIVDAMEQATQRVSEHGIVTFVIRNSQHTGCLAAYIADAAKSGLFVLLTAANTLGQRIAPFGGLDPVFSPSPFAVGIPNGDDSILIDLTMASAANSTVRQYYQRGEFLPAPWLLSAGGEPTNNPSALYEDPRGSILPLGGVDNGQKGFGLILFVEALTLALSGNGHGTLETVPSQSVFLQVIDPDAFAGQAYFREQISWIAAACRSSTPMHPLDGPPRLPGQRSLALKQEQLVNGVEISSDILERLRSCAVRAGLDLPLAVK